MFVPRPREHGKLQKFLNYILLPEYQVMPDETQNTSAGTKKHFKVSIHLMNNLFSIKFSACSEVHDSQMQDT